MYIIYNERTNEYANVEYADMFFAMLVADMMSTVYATYVVKIKEVL